MAGRNERAADVGDWIDEQVTNEVIATGFVIQRDLILSSAVDKGFLRASFNVSIGSPSSFKSDITDKNGASTISRNVKTLNSAKNIKYPTIYVENNLPYSYRIMEDGYSQQTPDKQLSITIQKAVNR